MKPSFLFLTLLAFVNALAQESYADSISKYIEKYVNTHEVVASEDRKRLQFFPINEKYRVVARFEPAKDNRWFTMETSGNNKMTFRVYGTVHFSINDTILNLRIYQSQDLMQREEYKNYLFLPFTDLSSGEESYATGRYIDPAITDIINNTLVIDFNKAYNPYCAYVSGKYNCPIPPRENNLPVAILAGEKNYSK
jgi:uncharacterized protein